jgi:hypothetical protein
MARMLLLVASVRTLKIFFKFDDAKLQLQLGYIKEFTIVRDNIKIGIG